MNPDHSGPVKTNGSPGDDAAQLVADAYTANIHETTYSPASRTSRLASTPWPCRIHNCCSAPATRSGGHLLPEVRYRGRDNAKIRFAAVACAAQAGGLEVDLLDEVRWGSDGYYDYAACAALALIRASSRPDRVSIADVAHHLANRSDMALSADDGPGPTRTRERNILSTIHTGLRNPEHVTVAPTRHVQQICTPTHRADEVWQKPLHRTLSCNGQPRRGSIGRCNTSYEGGVTMYLSVDSPAGVRFWPRCGRGTGSNVRPGPLVSVNR